MGVIIRTSRQLSEKQQNSSGTEDKTLFYTHLSESFLCEMCQRLNLQLKYEVNKKHDHKRNLSLIFFISEQKLLKLMSQSCYRFNIWSQCEVKQGRTQSEQTLTNKETRYDP